MNTFYKIALSLGVLILFVFVSSRAYALSTYKVIQGGTGSTSPSGILYGDNGATDNLKTITIGSNLTLTGTTLSATGGGDPFTHESATNSATTSLMQLFGQASTSQFTASSTVYLTGLSAGFLYLGSNSIVNSGASSTLFGYTPLNPTRQLTVAGTANQITSSAGAQDLSTDRTWTLSIPQAFQFPLSFTSTYGTTTYASSTVMSVSGQATLGTGGSNVGIGTTSPGSILAIDSSGTTNINVCQGAGNSCGFIGFTASGNQAFTMGTKSNAGIFFITNNTNRLNVTSSGFVGIATTTSQWGLEIMSATKPQLDLYDNTVDNHWSFRSIAGSLYIATTTYAATSTSAAFQFDPNGFPYFKTLSSASGNNCLQVDTTGKLTNTGAACSTGTVTSVTATAPIFSSGGATPNLTWAGLATTSNLTQSQILYNTSGGNGVASVATSSATINNGLTGTLTTINSQTQTIGLATINAGVLGAQLNGAVPTSQATSTLYGVGTPGYVLSFQNGQATWVATSSIQNITLTTTGSSGAATLIGTTLNIPQYSGAGTYPFTPGTQFGINTSATTTALQLTNGFTASSTAWISNLVVGTTTGNSFLNAPIIAGINSNNYAQIAIQNLSTGNNASSLFAAHADIGTDAKYYVEFGIDNSGYIQAAFNAQNPLDSFLNASDGALVIGTASTTNANADVRITTGGTASSSIRMTFRQNGFIGIGTSTPNVAALTIASTTAPQESWSAGAGFSQWTARNSNGTLYFATTSVTTTATSTTAALSIDTNGLVTIGSLASSIVSSVNGVLSQLLMSAAFTLSGNTLKENTWQSFTYATSTAWTGTTTIPLEVGYGETINNVRCFTDVGTVDADFYTGNFASGNKHLNYLRSASTTVGTTTMSTNNSFQHGTTTSVQIGTPASSPTKVTCTVSKTL